MAVYRLKADLVSILLSAGANPNFKDAFGATPLHVLSSSFYTHVWRWEYEGGRRWTEPEYATPSKERILEIARLLLVAGANPLETDHPGNTPIHLCVKARENIYDDNAYLELLDKLELDIRTRTSFLPVNFGGESPLHWACVHGTPRAVRLLLRHPDFSSSVNQYSTWSGTPLYIARANYHGGVHPGKASTQLKGGYVTYDGKEKGIEVCPIYFTRLEKH